MKVLYLTSETNFDEFDFNTVEARNQNKYGTMHSFKNKLELVTTEPSSDYHVFVSHENKDKTFLYLKSPQLNSALRSICEKLSKQGHVFREEKDTCYIRISKEQAAQIPKKQLLNVSVNVYGVFYQTSSKHNFLQMEVTGFRSYPLVQFD